MRRRSALHTEHCRVESGNGLGDHWTAWTCSPLFVFSVSRPFVDICNDLKVP